MHLAKIYSETKMKCGGCFALFVLMLAEFLNLNWSESLTVKAAKLANNDINIHFLTVKSMFDHKIAVHQKVFWNCRVCPGCFSQIKWRWTPQRKSHRQTHPLLLLLSSQCNRPPNPLPILNHPLQRHQPTNPTSSLSTRFPLLPPMWTSLTKLWTECHKVKCQKRTELLRVNLFLELHKPKALFRIEKRQISFMKRFGPTSKVFPLNLSEVI